jgi:hypothetical protein
MFMDNNKFSKLRFYANQGWPIFPVTWLINGGSCSCRDKECKHPGKHPFIPGGYKIATTDHDKIHAWHTKYPQANWAVATGSTNQGGAGIFVVDIDPRHGGDITWDMLRNEHPEPIETVTVTTGNKGSHLYFQYPPNGCVIKCGTDFLGAGIDIKSNGGLIIIPPSVTNQPYIFELNPSETPVAPAPDWIVQLVQEQPNQESPNQQAPPEEETVAGVFLLEDAHRALNALKKERADNYQQWLEVGMSLFSLGQAGLIAWDTWSKQSDKYEPGACAQKWVTFSPALGDANKIGFGSLLCWAEEDGAAPFIRPAPKKPKPSHYMKALAAQGYTFAVNDMNDMIYVNGTRMSDLHMAKIMTGLREYEYKGKDVALDVMASMGMEHMFHPIRDYLNSLVWEGSREEHWETIDWISALASYFVDRDQLFPILLRKWLVGAVQRVLGPRKGQQHPMWVLDGKQGIGKSRFVWWLGSPLPAFYIQNAINTEDKDFLIMLCSKWVWEVEELGSTIRKADIEALKAFISKEIINVRKPYGHDEIVKPATASFIGTINSSGGFLADPTGSRRFRCCTLTEIDWKYSRDIDVNQIWAQAVALFKHGETFELDPETEKRIIAINTQYEIDDPIAFDIFSTFNCEKDKQDQYTATAQIIYRLRADGKIVGGNDMQTAQRISNVLTRLGFEKDNVRVNGQKTRVWRGVWLKT